jgi:hypothetical protein
MPVKQERVAVLVRLPIDAKKWISRRALRNEASLNAEIVRMIRLQMEAESLGAMSSSLRCCPNECLSTERMNRQ